MTVDNHNVKGVLRISLYPFDIENLFGINTISFSFPCAVQVLKNTNSAFHVSANVIYFKL